MLLFSLMGTCASYMLFALGIILRNFPLLFFSRALDGFTGGNISVAQAVISDTTLPEHRAKNFGLIGGGVCLLLYHMRTVWWGLLVVAPFFSVFNGLTQANLIALLSRSASPRIQGEILGFCFSGCFSTPPSGV